MGRKNNRRNNRYKPKKSEIIRCTVHVKPVFEHEVCSSFSEDSNTNGKKNCENCNHSL